MTCTVCTRPRSPSHPSYCHEHRREYVALWRQGKRPDWIGQVGGRRERDAGTPAHHVIAAIRVILDTDDLHSFVLAARLLKNWMAEA